MLLDCDARRGRDHRRGGCWRRRSKAGPVAHAVDPFSLTIGVSAFPGLAHDRQQLVHQADAALYWGKRHGRTDIQLFDPRRHGMADDWRSLEELAAAVSRVAADRLLTPVYQPIYDLRRAPSWATRASSARCPRPASTNVAAMFVAAESTGRTVELDLASLETVIAGAADLDRATSTCPSTCRRGRSRPRPSTRSSCWR